MDLNLPSTSNLFYILNKVIRVLSTCAQTPPSTNDSNCYDNNSHGIRMNLHDNFLNFNDFDM